MKTIRCTQRSPEWHAARKGSIGGTRFGQAVSNRKNKLLFDLLAERISDYPVDEVFVNDAMQFGIDQEPYARAAYIKQSKIRFMEVGLILSDFSKIHHASPDGLNRRLGAVLEVKCTQDVSKQIQRYFDGIDPEHMAQIVNYFAVSDSIKVVHYVSYNPFCIQRPLVVHIVKRDDYLTEIEAGRGRIAEIENRLNEMERLFKF